MIHEVDEALRNIVKREALNGTDVEIVFDAPTKDWSARRNAPTLDIYLYDIREDLKRRHYGMAPTHNDAGNVSGRRGPPRWYKLSYLVTAWTQRPEDEHRLLSAVLVCFSRRDGLAPGAFSGVLRDQGLPAGLTIALPPPEDRALSDVWSALGGELKPSLDLVLTVPLDAKGVRKVGPLVLEEPRFLVEGPNGRETVSGRRRAAAEAVAAAAVKRETVEGGNPPQPGRTFHIHEIERPEP